VCSSDLFPRERFAAELFYVNPAIDPQTASVQVKLRVPSPPVWIRQDMTVSVDVEVARADAALVLPLAAVHGPLSEHPWILVAENGRAHRRAVRLGLSGGGRAVVEEGVAATDPVIPVRAAISEGDRLQPMIESAAKGGAP
jgi:HlyD family secretion protein